MTMSSSLSFGAASALLLLLRSPSSSAEVSRESHRSFSDSLVPLIYSNDNDCSSTWGVSLMLDLALPGGTEQTKEELCNVVALCESGESSLLWKDTVSRLTSTHDGSCLSEFNNVCESATPTLQVANSVWTTTGRALSPQYSDVVGDFLQQTDFSDPEAGGVVNSWVNATTNGLIDSILPDGPIQYDLVVINSIYLKAQWALQFSESFTNEDAFYSSPTRESALSDPARFMHKVDFYHYSDDAIPGYQIIQLPYINSILSMIVVLPKTLEAAKVTSAEVVATVPSMLSLTRVALALPKFKFESKYGASLQLALKELGLMAPFNPAQGFCGLFEGSCQFLDVIIQKTFIDVNEMGTEAAAVTLGAFTTSFPPQTTPILFRADHEFQFFIYDKDEDLVIFEGQVGAPDVPDGEPEAKLKSMHSDEAFWTSNFNVDPTIPEVETARPAASPTPPPESSTPQPTPSSAFNTAANLKVVIAVAAFSLYFW